MLETLCVLMLRCHDAVDTGKAEITVLSGLNGKVPLDNLQNRLVVVMLNLKPVKSGFPPLKDAPCLY